MKRKITQISAGLLLTAFLAGCSTATGGGSMPGMDHGASTPATSSASMSTGTGTAQAGQHNAADTMFAQMMIVHHQQAVEMSNTMLAKKGTSQRIRDLAAAIKLAQGPEIEKMKSMLASWGEAETMAAEMPMPGMMSAAELKKLAATNGTAADRLFLTQMIAHHQGALESAKAEQQNGQNAEAVQLAQGIMKNQQPEIDQMNKLLGEL
ncbi:DUF305 domain-containing protein [Psychromicrobium lacuslunae]|uniref:DUF305 domain-containing protein n=1 Tax=Psychromicrobium lacuslunae TaxID=1618207 RepID=A0A0D4C0Y0_9MICC|nr:DUF305 domain-containing protein [Psychromicrobium lacuslunae]AJT42214.1 hypothetical protein UM93_13160 [Psychromicrobium lacuslunae]